MSVHLVGGGWSVGVETDVFGRFVEEAGERAAARGARSARVVVVAVRDGDQDEHVANLAARLRTAGEALDVEVTVAPAAVQEGEALPADTVAVEGAPVDGIVVGGGLTPAYLDAVAPHADAVRAHVVAGAPYLGFSAGAMIAPDQALIGGWRIGGVEVSPEDGSEDLDDVTVVPGLGLVDVTVDVHAAQWGNLSRLVAAVESGLLDGGVAVDEDTVLVVGQGGLVVGGRGNVWRAVRGGDDSGGVIVSTLVG
ncbi:Type 1 glutamine amidotransferase-like domain-containing protein [Luteimicrobium sp. NPDC057192]|uniref:Type 1 glutamine amidotransferase-like domain-containing protein n=1 Tax=Luteimicrobium sp. NPDC057192 TaxID=3346042 RepID=UPI0036264A90